jgi:hypothetical protein
MLFTHLQFTLFLQIKIQYFIPLQSKGNIISVTSFEYLHLHNFFKLTLFELSKQAIPEFIFSQFLKETHLCVLRVFSQILAF